MVIYHVVEYSVALNVVLSEGDKLDVVLSEGDKLGKT
jgi:hypothetical protein